MGFLHLLVDDDLSLVLDAALSLDFLDLGGSDFLDGPLDEENGPRYSGPG